MAEFTLIVFPQDPNFVPGNEAAVKAKELLAEYLDVGEISTDTFPTPRFIHSGDSLETFTCPACGASVDRFELDEEDGGEWWEDFIGAAESATDVASATLKMPCCDGEACLAKIDFGGEAAFARFQIVAPDPVDTLEVNETQKEALEQVLGCKLRQLVSVWA